MIFYAGLLIAGLLQGVMISLNGQLGKYYSLFGITLFVHGIALVLLLFMGCVACLYSLWTGKKSFKYWMMYGAVSLALLHLY